MFPQRIRTIVLIAFTALAVELMSGCDGSNAVDAQGSHEAAQPVEGTATEDRDPLAVPKMPRIAPGMMGVFGDRYWNLPYAVVNEEQGLAFLKAYEDYLRKSEQPPDTLKVPEGQGMDGGDTIHRLEVGVSDMFIQDINDPAATAVSQSDVPMVIAQPKPSASGANVLYMDGHVQFVERGDFPLTEDFLAALKRIDPPEYAENNG